MLLKKNDQQQGGASSWFPYRVFSVQEVRTPSQQTFQVPENIIARVIDDCLLSLPLCSLVNVIDYCIQISCTFNIEASKY